MALRRMRILALLGCSIACSPSPRALAQGATDDAAWRHAEVRLGVLAHDVRFAGGTEGGVDLNAEIDSSTLTDPGWTAGAPLWAQSLLHPRAHLGIEPNLNGRTSQIYAGLTWTTVLARGLLDPQDALELSYLFGPSLNDGDHDSRSSDRKSLGSNILFHLGAEVSYRITQHLAVGLYYDHSSNGGLARHNDSLNDLGLRLGYRF